MVPRDATNGGSGEPELRPNTALAKARDAAQTSNEVLKITIIAFEAGSTTNIEVIDAQASLVRARDTDIDARFAAAAARIALARASGTARLLH